MKNSRAQGNKNQAWIKAWLTERGWTVRNFPVQARPVFGPGGKPLMRNGVMVFRKAEADVWGADLIARKEIAPGDPCLLWIQASGSSGVKKRVEEFRKYFSFLLGREYLQLWIKAGRDTWNVRELSIRDDGEHKELGKIIRRKWFSSGGWVW